MSAVQQKKMSLQYLRKKTLKMANDRKNATVPVFNAVFEKVTLQLVNYTTNKVSPDWQKIHGKKQKHFIKAAEKLATGNPFVWKEQR